MSIAHPPLVPVGLPLAPDRPAAAAAALESLAAAVERGDSDAALCRPIAHAVEQLQWIPLPHPLRSPDRVLELARRLVGREGRPTPEEMRTFAVELRAGVMGGWVDTLCGRRWEQREAAEEARSR